MARGSCGEVTGVGRYPAREFRPRSKYSIRSESTVALNDLLRNVASRGATAILTFPDHDCSTGLSGDSVIEIAVKHFEVRVHRVARKFCTLGGTWDDRGDKAGRSARKNAQELILVLKPK